MSKKLFMGLAPVLAVAALAVMPPAAQAEPHFYKNGVLLEEGELGDLGSSGLDTTSWGTLNFGLASSGLVKCESVFSFDIKNPLGGGAGQAAVDGWVAYDCTGPICEGSGGKFEVLPEGLREGKEWTGVLVEEGAGELRLKLGNKEEASETKIKFEEFCAARAEKIKWHGELKPKFINGTEIGIAPSKIEFAAASGTLETSNGNGEVTAKLKILGYEGQELLTAKNP